MFRGVAFVRFETLRVAVFVRSRTGWGVVVRDGVVVEFAARVVMFVRSRPDVVVDVVRRFVLRDEFWVLSATAVPNNSGARHAIKSSLIPFILLLINNILSYLKKWASGNNEKKVKKMVRPGGIEPPRVAPQHP